jgi:NAD(P)-dependent dehydrogenase (short-subunit alcohol dehydrogenase family)
MVSAERQNILITGISSGLGFGLAVHYLEQGHRIFGIGRKSNPSIQHNPEFRFLSLDLSRHDELEQQVPVLLKNINTLHLVILNAGILNEVKDLGDTGLEEVKHVMDVNVWGNKVLIDTIFKSIDNVLQIIAISSGASVSGARGWNAYALSKAAFNMMIKLYAEEHPDCHFCALAPGLVDTAMQDYISSLPDDENFPVVQKLKKAKGTPDMPQPAIVAKNIVQSVRKIRDSHETGSYLDLRKI